MARLPVGPVPLDVQGGVPLYGRARNAAAAA